MSQILGIKFRDHGQIYYFDSGAFVVSVGEHVVVETDQGLGMGQVVAVRDDLPEDVEQTELKPIFRLADEEDLAAGKENEAMGRDAFRYCRRCIRERELEMKLVDVEVYHDRSKMIFYFTAPGRIDFRELVKDLVREYRTRIELRQIGVRHETQMIGAIGNCGQLCCCRRFMRKFEPVTIKMAKEQNLFLNPTKISGMCGRLLCCLAFEQENYEEFQKKCPRTGKKYATGLGQVKVLRTNFFRQSIIVYLESGEERELSLEDWELALDGQVSGEATPPASPPQQAQRSGDEQSRSRGRKPRGKGRERGDAAGASGEARASQPGAAAESGKASERQPDERRASERKAPDRKSAERQPDERRSPERQASAVQPAERPAVERREASEPREPATAGMPGVPAVSGEAAPAEGQTGGRDVVKTGGRGGDKGGDKGQQKQGRKDGRSRRRRKKRGSGQKNNTPAE